jgi:hypothetical protein
MNESEELAGFDSNERVHREEKNRAIWYQGEAERNGIAQMLVVLSMRLRPSCPVLGPATRPSQTEPKTRGDPTTKEKQ